MNNLTALLIYFTPMALVLYVYLRRRRRQLQTAAATLAENTAAGLTEPASLHPVIDPLLCIGCAACADACPEMPDHMVIGIINGKAKLVSPTDCIGHGACQAACPMDAIELVFGSEHRGVDIPSLKPNFETNVPGIYIAGELGGMGLIRNAIEQGRQAMENIAKSNPGKTGLDVLVVGAGPAGFAAALAAKEQGLSCVTVEQESLGGTVAHFPRGKLVMTAPAMLPLVGKMNFRETSKENLLAFWQDVQRKAGLSINFQETVESIAATPSGFRVQTSSSSYEPANILLCLGRRGTPRKLAVAGEDLNKVTYRLIDAEQYRGMAVLVVGGGDSALEAACTLAEYDDIAVTLAYRGSAFNRAKAKNRDKALQAEQAGRLTLLLDTNVRAIDIEKVRVMQKDTEISFANDAVIISAGGILPTGFLKTIGIDIQTKFGQR